MPNPNIPRITWDIELVDEDATEHLAMDIAVALAAGDLVTLSGDLGAGKTTLARAMIRYLAADPDLDVPSPTFTLMQIYELPRFPLIHVDLYRVTTVAELTEIGWRDAAEGAVVLVEWADRATSLLQQDRLDIALMLVPRQGPTFRRVRLTGYGAWAGRLAQLRAARTLLDASGFGSAVRMHLEGDASGRSYERLHLTAGTAVLMKHPPRSGEPKLRHGRTYSETAHLAQNVRPFVALARGLRDRGLSAPEIYAADLEGGVLLLEDFGSERFVTDDPPAPMESRYIAAIDVLIALHSMDLPEKLPVAPRIEHKLMPYDLDAFMIEIELLFDWYLPYRGAKMPEAASREAFLTDWRLMLAHTLSEPKTWVLRDYHSPNLMWLPQRMGIQSVGLLDFQDAVLGPPAYDVASLLMDARVDVPDALELKLLARYAAGRRLRDPNFNPAHFAARYVLMGAQRATKILGIFARLDRRDRKPQYIRHMPRVWSYLQRCFAHPSLEQLAAWYNANVPPPAGYTAPQPASQPAPNP
jgi:N-acetylmuramate 1-kinase